MAGIKGRIISRLDKIAFKKNILTDLANQINVDLGRNIDKIKQVVRTLIEDIVINCPEMQSLRDGEQLAKSFGIKLGTGDSIIQAIAKQVALSADIIHNPVSFFGKQPNGGIHIGIIKDDYRDIIGLPIAKYISTNQTTGESTLIPWLEWLIFAGDSIIIKTYSIAIGKFKKSRSGGAIMRKITKKADVKKIYGPFNKQNSAVGWRVPPKYSGLDNNNFLTRAFNLRQSEFEYKIVTYIDSILG